MKNKQNKNNTKKKLNEKRFNLWSTYDRINKKKKKIIKKTLKKIKIYEYFNVCIAKLNRIFCSNKREHISFTSFHFISTGFTQYAHCLLILNNQTRL